ncbi:fungal-specific transcription factor domain-containing protein [Umbelopsis sp. AD052]|nr:fungal-specific transcription factor domain-containing protein [Umbelopsis sp. AD052]
MESDRDSTSSAMQGEVVNEDAGSSQPPSKRTRATSTAEPTEEISSAPATSSKRIRMTMACERCRTKKVKCDFAHPVCTRCKAAGVQCCYGGKETQIDLFNLIRLNDTVESLQERVRSIESNLTDIRSNTQIVVDEIRIKHENLDQAEREQHRSVEHSDDTLPESSRIIKSRPIVTDHPLLADPMAMRLPGPKSNWKLSLTHSGLRIDTDILSMSDLYNILFSGMRSRGSMDEADNEVASPGSSSESSKTSLEHTVVAKSHPLWKSKTKTFPLYSMWEPATHSETKMVDSNESFTPAVLKQLIDIHHECFLCFPMVDIVEFRELFESNRADPLLVNAILAWSARHAAIYHGLFPGKDPNSVGEGFFEISKNILKERFSKATEVTMQGLLIMYVYCIGKGGPKKAEYESEAYLYLGLAIRMCLDMRMHMEHPGQDRVHAEKRRRLFWLCFFLETLCSAHSDKPFSFPEDQTHVVEAIDTLPSETDECYFRVQFTKHRFKITQIYREIAIALEKKDPYFSRVTQLDKKLTEWFHQLPDFFRYQKGDLAKRQWKSTSFREQGCIKLNIEMNFQLCQLYSAFMEPPGETNSAVGLIAEQNCVHAADTIVELLECFSMLEQLWCHFTLENLMMVTSIYSMLLLKNQQDTVQSAKLHLRKIVNILIQAPVRQQKQVVNLIQQIQQLLLQNGDATPPHSDTTTSRASQESTPAPSTTVINYHPDNHEAVVNYNVLPLSNPNHTYSPPQASTALAIHSESMPPPFEMPTHLTAGDLFQFTDFVYTPTLMDYDPMEQYRQQDPSRNNMRLPLRRPSYQEFVDNRMGGYNGATPDQYMGPSFVYYSDK